MLLRLRKFFFFVFLFISICISAAFSNELPSRLIIHLNIDGANHNTHNTSRVRGHHSQLERRERVNRVRSRIELAASEVTSRHGVYFNPSSEIRSFTRVISEDESKFILEVNSSTGSLEQILKKVKKDFDTQDIDIEIDRLFTHYANSVDWQGGVTDQRFFEQWALHHSSAGINAPNAWDYSKGSSSIVIAVLDTGITAHSDLNGRVLPGASTISDPVISNDGSARKNSALDPGDWVESGDPCYQGSFEPSSWHGTHVAGTIGAKTGNGVGIAGVDWNAKILPVRVLGKCGGRVSDIADGIRWAVGINVSGLAPNPHPANVINLSLGGPGRCGTTMQQAIDQANSRGAVVVVASGNQGADLDFQEYSPANCRGVINVGATNIHANATSYSNLGSSIDVMAPGGDFSRGVISTLNSGQRGPVSEAYAAYNGTSMAAPHISGIVGLILGATPGLHPGQVKEILKDTSRPLQSYLCNSNRCGAGLADAYEAVRLAMLTEPDRDFVGSDPITSRPGYPDGGDMKGIERSSGCASIVDVNKGPPSGGLFMVFTLFILLPSLGFGRAVKLS